MLANLILSVHPSCKWFVQTSASNICRLIDEIRTTDGFRQGAAWVDLEAEACISLGPRGTLCMNGTEW